MCPACFGVAAAYFAGASSIGGVTTLLFRRLGRDDGDDRTDKVLVKDDVRNGAADQDSAAGRFQSGSAA